MDSSPEPRDLPAVDWAPEPAPSELWLAGESLVHAARHPDRLLKPVALPASPLSAELRPQRRFVTVSTTLDHHRQVRDAHGGTVNDVVLAVVTGALRSWLLTRAEPVTPTPRVRVMVPLSVRDEAAEPTSLGSHVAGKVVTLPVGEPNPVLRLHHISYALKAHRETGRAVSANRLVAMPAWRRRRSTCSGRGSPTARRRCRTSWW
ncbi:MAG: wax ester/triacylglycerol synthase family O-acyltransferase [Actinomycetota bacterium]|nr:wax ester/triacylglycerol synthase family O-acyltransferase [Actinomycetota bacterium]